MSRSTAQALVCSMSGVDQNVAIQPAEQNNTAQQLAVEMSIPYQLVEIYPAQKLGTE